MICRIFAATAAAVTICDAVGVVLLTSIGLAPTIYNLVADQTLNMVGGAAVAASALFMALLFIFDFHRMPAVLQLLCTLILAGMMFGAAVLKGITYPWAPGLLCIAFPIFFVGWMRAFHFKPAKVPPVVFLQPSALAFGLAAIVVFAIWLVFLFGFNKTMSEETRIWLTDENDKVLAYLWHNGTTQLNYTMHCSASKDVSAFSADERTTIEAACDSAASVWLFQWAGPMVLAVCHGVTAAFMILFMWVAQRMVVKPAVEADSEAEEASLLILKRTLKGCTLTVVLMLALMYASASYVSGASGQLGSAIFCLGAVTIAATIGWMYTEIDHSQLRKLTTEGKVTANIVKMMRSDWARAIAVGCLNIFIPLMALLDMTRQCMRRVRGRAGEGEAAKDKFTPMGRQAANECSMWNWCGILLKVIVLGEIFVALLIGMKVTYVFFAWLNTTLAAANINFWILVVLVLCIGLGMFLCPIVPGSAVYLFAGVVLGAQSQLDGRPGFAVGVLAAIVASSFAKLTACVGQYLMGYLAGQSIKVQQMVGVDKVPTRATEKILKQPGLSLGKVCILVAGPDFPTSMLCGILRLSIPQMLIGTMPVILVSIIPQVLVGGLITYQGSSADDGSSSVLSMVSTAVTGFAAASQAGATLLFSWRIMKTVEQDSEELAKPRPEHEAVAELTKQEGAFRSAYADVTKWDAMTSMQKAVLLTAVIAMLLAGFLIAADFMIVENFLFRKFAITNKISDAYDLGGLENNALNLVIMPNGWIALGVAVAAMVEHYIFSKCMAKAARGRMQSLSKNPQIPNTVIGAEEDKMEVTTASFHGS